MYVVYDYTNKRSASFANYTSEGKTPRYRLVQRYVDDKVRTLHWMLFKICSIHRAMLYPSRFFVFLCVHLSWFCLDNIVRTTETFAAKRNIIVLHHCDVSTFA